MMKLVIFAAVLAVAAAAPGGLYGGYGDLGLGSIAVAHAPVAVAHAPVAVAHAPVATSYANVNLVSRPAVVAVQPTYVKTIATPAIHAPISYGHGW
ncbi:larval/pupal cuticle protein H1C-like [Frankliniella occidentalis]|uniref:Larval/pupal cuticle protein H1C-like n=1 Tax=Frankliniella occidentalis TaxID=133901 RepID=A0A6J1SST0_FRAOC|nr:larval/pupal cuticle protein H1C-like [Frankliniella occidentalis]